MPLIQIYPPGWVGLTLIFLFNLKYDKKYLSTCDKYQHCSLIYLLPLPTAVVLVDIPAVAEEMRPSATAAAAVEEVDDDNDKLSVYNQSRDPPSSHMLLPTSHDTVENTSHLFNLASHVISLILII